MFTYNIILYYFKLRVKNGFDKLKDSLKAKLSDAKEFVKATVQELLSVPQDVLSSLQVCSRTVNHRMTGLIAILEVRAKYSAAMV